MSNCLETERKYLIRKPNFQLLSGLDGYTVSDIEQIYLDEKDGLTRRVRMIKYADRVEYTENTKRRISKMTCIENEVEITKERYLELKSEIASDCSPLYKRRHTFYYLGQTLEIDEYPSFLHSAILEIELKSEDTIPAFPEFIEIISEVTGDKKYSNHSMAKSFPDENL